MSIQAVKVDGRKALLAKLPGGYVKLVFLDGEIRIARPVPKLAKAAIDTAAHEAAASTRNDLKPPTRAQSSAGNYKKGHITVGGIDIAIENPAGSRRRPEWPVLKAHYGYIKRTMGADEDQIDVFVRPGTDEDYSGPVYVIDQLNQKDGSFDEHKTLIGWRSKQSALACYLSAYQPGWKVGPVTKLNWSMFVDWVRNGDGTEPVKNG